MRNLHRMIAVAAAVLAVTFASTSASAGGNHRNHSNNNYRQDSRITATITIGNLGLGRFYDLQPYQYRQPGNYRRAEGRQGRHNHRHYRRHNRDQYRYDRHRHSRGHRHDNYRRQHNGRGGYRPY
ncbi:MAG: hypothetical protein ACTSX7_19180 [Alphaproteobacteria bacterium]